MPVAMNVYSFQKHSGKSKTIVSFIQLGVIPFCCHCQAISRKGEGIAREIQSAIKQELKLLKQEPKLSTLKGVNPQGFSHLLFLYSNNCILVCKRGSYILLHAPTCFYILPHASTSASTPAPTFSYILLCLLLHAYTSASTYFCVLLHLLLHTSTCFYICFYMLLSQDQC